MAHAQATDGIKSAVRAGIRSIEHGIYLDDEAIEMMLERGTYLVPTLIAPMGVLEAADRGVTVPPYAIEKTKMVIDVPPREHPSGDRRRREGGDGHRLGRHASRPEPARARADGRCAG